MYLWVGQESWGFLQDYRLTGGCMKTLQTVQLKPNPPGKDRTRYGGATATQLGAEWADIKNVGSRDVDLTGVELYHIAYSTTYPNGRWELVTRFSSGGLRPGQVVRVHSGRVNNIGVLRQEDLAGADFHIFTGRDSYIWNNDRADCASLWMTGASNEFDKACYTPNPPEGVVLHRVGDSLVPSTVTASARRY
jgi:hypothetical protein